LRAIVEQYVATALPVGSQTVTQTTGLGVSAATVRNEMAVLEGEGYITQPHTSAGRVPTDRGYRYFVDHLAGAGQLPVPERRRIAEFFTSATMAMDDLLAQTSHLLAGVTAHAAVVVGPETQAVVVRSAHLVQLQPRVLLAVVVLSNGAVEKEVVAVDDDLDDSDVADASARFSQYLDGLRRCPTPGPTTPPRVWCARRATRCARTSSNTTATRCMWVGRAAWPPSTTPSCRRASPASSSCSNSTQCWRA
jgi:heat-inducible transcriptional repressor